MVFKWRDDHTDKFMEFYKEEECLWNICSELYKNKTARNVAYNKICEQMNLPELTVADIKNKIKIIRTNYKIELNKIIKSAKCGSGLDDIYVPRVFWFKKADSFLRGVTSIKEDSSDLSNLIPQDACPQEEEELVTYFKEEDQVSVKEFSVNTERTESKQTTRHANKKHKSDLTVVESSINKLQKIVSTCIEDEDEFDYFGKSIAVQLKKMPIERALICQETLQSVLREERLHQIHLKSAISLSASPSCSNLSYSSSESTSFHETNRNTIDAINQQDNTKSHDTKEKPENKRIAFHFHFHKK